MQLKNPYHISENGWEFYFQTHLNVNCFKLFVDIKHIKNIFGLWN